MAARCLPAAEQREGKDCLIDHLTGYVFFPWSHAVFICRYAASDSAAGMCAEGTVDDFE